MSNLDEAIDRFELAVAQWEVRVKHLTRELNAAKAKRREAKGNLRHARDQQTAIRTAEWHAKNIAPRT